MFYFCFNDCIPKGSNPYLVVHSLKSTLTEYKILKEVFPDNITGIITEKSSKDIILDNDNFSLFNCISMLDRSLRIFAYSVFNKLPIDSYLTIKDEESLINNKDSVYRFQGIIPPVEYQYNLDEFFIQPLFNQIPDEILFEDNPSNIWLRTELLISNNSQSEFGEVNTFFTAPLYQQYLRDSEFDVVRYVLGTIQTGAVAYMAYRHIKKYGFLK